MLSNFFKLNDLTKEFNQEQLLEHFNNAHELRNAIYKPDKLVKANGRIKIKNINFFNTSFSKTIIENVIFINCKFEDCLFLGTRFVGCEFHNCVFKEVNPYKIKFEKTYINPSYFSSCFQGQDKKEIANIAVNLYQQLLENSKKEEQAEFARISEYQFERWKDYLLWNKFLKGKPYKISLGKFLLKMPMRILYKYTLGYGLRLRNLAISFLCVFIIFGYINHIFWDNYHLELRDVKSVQFFSDTTHIIANIFYTFECTTSLIDSQLQPTTNIGMSLLTIQGIVGFIFLSGLVTILINIFVK